MGGLTAGFALAAWAFFSRLDAVGTSAEALAVVLVLAGFAVGALATQIHPALPASAVGAGVLVAVVMTFPRSVSGAPQAPPIGYGNADGTLLLVATAALIVAVVRLDGTLQLATAIGVLVTTGLCVMTASVAATAACLLLLGFTAVRRLGPTWMWQLVAGSLIVVPVGLTYLWGSGARPPAVVVDALSSQRLALWSDAVSLAEAQPVRGVGAGAFALRSRVAMGDSDLAWAHSEPLQIAAELGFVGLALLALLLACGVIMLRRDAMLLALLVLPATIDYVFHFGWVLLAGAVVLGAASADFSADVVSGAGKPVLTPPSP